MGYGTRPNTFGGKIQTFWPDDTNTEFYIQAGAQLNEILAEVSNKWPTADITKIRISADYIHTDCLSYDLHDSGDYTNFICVSRDS